ncbi:hypothetical protein LLG46_15525 [bacterium]|nr:hypothetical protein [bacterium]
MIWLLVTVTVLLSVILILLVVGLAIYFRRLSRATYELEETLKAFREEIMPLAEEAGRVLRHTNDLVIATRMQVDRVGRAAQSVEDLVEGKTIVGAAEKAVSSSRATLLSMVQGIKEGIKTLRSAKQSKEESNDE